ncbi:CAP domain-containing protein [Haloarchaeobius sp. HME9146]|uniref:CAP domain-containing protein n=1 Tax=Haloarchaeobius sp. HME9146 TaxID=2978732 RepID=UPI0021C164AD|nr:CAP domain-containing protein [Haloarchaeobius sp. HME9146]
MSALARLLLVLSIGALVLALNPSLVPVEAQYQPPEPEVPADLDDAAIEAAIHDKVNELRVEQGLRPLVFDQSLAEVSRYHSSDMAAADYVGHVSPSGETVLNRYDQFRYDCRIRAGTDNVVYGGENVFFVSFAGVSYTDDEIAERAVDGWMNSTGHRENLLSDYWFREGVGVVVDVDETAGNTSVYVTQNFC